MCLFIKDGKCVEKAGCDILCYKKTRSVNGERNKWRGVYVGVRKYAYNRILTAERRIVEDGEWAYTEVEHLKPERQWPTSPRINEGFHAKTRVVFPTWRGYHYCVIPKGTEMCYGKDEDIVAVRMIVFRCIWNYIGYKLKNIRK